MNMESELKIISYNIRNFSADKHGIKHKTVVDLLEACDFLLLQEILRYESSRIF